MLNMNDASGFIFDCDGTLIDSLGAWDQAEQELFARSGPLTREQEDEIHSAPIEEAARILHEKYGVMESAEAVLAHLDGVLVPFYRDKCEALPGACDFVRKVSDAGVPCVVLSSSPRRYLEAGLRRVGILDCFRELLSTDEVGCSKQDFLIYERALKVMGSTKADTWAVDDAPYAIGVMRDFGLNTIAVGNGCDAAREQLLRERSTLFVGSLAELV